MAYLALKFLPTHLSCSLLDTRLNRSSWIEVVRPLFVAVLGLKLGFQFVGFVLWRNFFGMVKLCEIINENQLLFFPTLGAGKNNGTKSNLKMWQGRSEKDKVKEKK